MTVPSSRASSLRVSRSWRDGLDRAVQRGADRLGPKRVAVLVGAADAQQRAHVGGQVAQFPFAFVRDRLADAVGEHALLDLVVLDQA